MPKERQPDEPPRKRGLQSDGRAENAAEPLDAAEDNAGAERYPPADRDDSIEPRSFAKTRNNPPKGKR